MLKALSPPDGWAGAGRRTGKGLGSGEERILMMWNSSQHLYGKDFTPHYLRWEEQLVWSVGRINLSGRCTGRAEDERCKASAKWAY